MVLLELMRSMAVKRARYNCKAKKSLEVLEAGRGKSDRPSGREECSNNFPTALHREYLLSSEFALSVCSRVMSPWSSLQHGQVQRESAKRRHVLPFPTLDLVETLHVLTATC